MFNILDLPPPLKLRPILLLLLLLLPAGSARKAALPVFRLLTGRFWHGPPLSPCKILFKSRDARRRERTKCDVLYFFLFFFENNAVSRLPIWCVVELLPQDIASAFAGRFRRFRWYLQRFFRKKSHFQPIEQFSKFSLRLVPEWPGKIWKSEKMGAKFMRTTSTI